ncbi:MAG: tetratricopeptide repeat protein [Ignavibacteriae bacterium]|nr:tetratricopeptide repeat protein [Ignavibacteriota bacterium]
MVLSTHQGAGNVMRAVAAGMALFVSLFVIGCSGSEEMLQQQQQQIADQQQQLDAVQTENTSLRQRIVKLEQDNKNLEARLSEAEAKVTMEAERANKAEADLSKAMKTKTSAPAMTEMTSMSAETPAGYAEAWSAFSAKNYDDAIAKYEALLSGGVASNWADNCHYWIGECYYGKKNFQEAINHFEMVTGYAGSEKIADAHFMMAQSYDRLGDKAKAKSHYETVANEYPSSPKVEVAKQRAASR